MIIVQDKDKNYLASYSTLKEFLKNYYGVTNIVNQYEYIRSKIAKSNGKTIKYKDFLLTKDTIIRGKKYKFDIKLKNNRFIKG